jgi:hypothetical protein
MTDLNQVSVDEIDTTKPHSARMYDYFLQGKDNYEADQVAAEKAKVAFPTAEIAARANRQFMHRTTRWLATEAGIRQFLDIGTGIPTRPNLHQVAQEVAPDSRVVYADNDPIVLRHAEALMRSTPEGRTAYIQADVKDPASILAAEELHEVLDLTRPVALSVNALLHFVPDEHRPYDIVSRLLEPLVPGSYLVLSHLTYDFDRETIEGLVESYGRGGIPTVGRSWDETLRFFEGLELVEPGLVSTQRWRPQGEPLEGATDAAVSVYGAVGRKS